MPSLPFIDAVITTLDLAKRVIVQIYDLFVAQWKVNDNWMPLKRIRIDNGDVVFPQI